MEKDERYSLFCQMIDQLDRGAYLIEKYDSLLHDYYGAVLFPGRISDDKGHRRPRHNCAALAEKFDKTPSACSQLVRKLKAKRLGQAGQELQQQQGIQSDTDRPRAGKYQKHQDFENACYRRTLPDVSTAWRTKNSKVISKYNSGSTRLLSWM